MTFQGFASKCPIEKCTWETKYFELNNPEPREVDALTANYYSIHEHLKEEHDGKDAWED